LGVGFQDWFTCLCNTQPQTSAVHGSWFMVSGFGFRAPDPAVPDSGFCSGVPGPGFRILVLVRGCGSRVSDSGTCSGFRIQGSGFGYNLDGSRRGNNARARLLLPVERLLVVPVHRQPLALLSAFGFRYSGFVFLGFWILVSGSSSQVSGCGFRVFGFLYSGFGFLVSGFWFLVLVLRFRGSGSVFRVPGSLCRV